MRIITIAALVFVLTGPSFAAGFNCAKASTKIEKMICADTELSALDSELKLVFDSARMEHSGYDGETGERVDPVGKSQKQWLAKDRAACRTIECLKSVYRSRIHQIKTKWPY